MSASRGGCGPVVFLSPKDFDFFLCKCSVAAPVSDGFNDIFATRAVLSTVKQHGLSEWEPHYHSKEGRYVTVWLWIKITKPLIVRPSTYYWSMCCVYVLETWCTQLHGHTAKWENETEKEKQTDLSIWHKTKPRGCISQLYESVWNPLGTYTSLILSHHHQVPATTTTELTFTY